VGARGEVGSRDLRIVAAAICLSALGDGVALVALALRAKELSGSGMGGGVSIAALFICLWAPLVVLAGHVGLLVDRVETRSLLIVTSLAQAALAAALAFVGSLAALFVLAALAGIGIAIAQAAEFALVPAAAGERTVQQANALVETSRALGFTVGPACGSFLVAAGGTAAAMLVDAASFLVVALGALALVARRTSAGEHEGERRRARDGLAFLIHDRLLALMVAVVVVSLLFMSASIPADVIYVEDVLEVENIGLGIVFTAWTFGMLVGSNVFGRRVAVPALAAATFAGVIVQGLGKFFTPLWVVFGFMVAMYFVGGVGHGLKNVTSRTLIHTRVAADRHGRAFAAWNGLRNGAELGALAAGGVLVGLLGASWTLWLAGGLSALAGFAGLLVLASWRGRASEVDVSPGTIGSQ
jgi:MFS family permease